MSGDEFTAWWSEILERDQEYARAWQRDHDDATGLPDDNPLLACVFCRRPLDEEIGGGRGHMIAYWRARPSEASHRIIAAGLYCAGREEGCVDDATRAGFLGDDHATHATGRNAIPHMERRVRHNGDWEVQALRRIVLIYAELSRLPTLDGA